jgi:hypothetical protein
VVQPEHVAEQRLADVRHHPLAQAGHEIEAARGEERQQERVQDQQEEIVVDRLRGPLVQAVHQQPHHAGDGQGRDRRQHQEDAGGGGLRLVPGDEGDQSAQGPQIAPLGPAVGGGHHGLGQLRAGVGAADDGARGFARAHRGAPGLAARRLFEL